MGKALGNRFKIWLRSNSLCFSTMIEWLKNLFRPSRYEVIIYFPGKVTEKPDGSKEKTFNPKTYNCKKLSKITDTHFIFILETGDKVEINTVKSVGYDVVKKK